MPMRSSAKSSNVVPSADHTMKYSRQSLRSSRSHLDRHTKDFFDIRLIKELEDTGFINELYGQR
jgi:hypothetical protein